MNERNPGTIITFYSYKGGTGRTMALANTACLLAKRFTEEKKQDRYTPRILAIDWDFEAPGLHYYFKDRLTPQAKVIFDNAPGCIDLFVELKASTSQYIPGDFVGNRIRARESLRTLNFDQYLLETSISGLSIIKSGRYDSNYPQVVNQFDWNNFFYTTFGLFNGFADYLRERFDYVLVDSRTGVTDTSGICTMLLPDKLVAVFTLNHQSLSGLEDIIAKSVAYRKSSPDGRALTVFPLASRIETAKPQMFDAWRNGATASNKVFPWQTQPIFGYQPLFEKLFRDIYDLKTIDMTEYFNEVQIQHIPDYAYGEPIAAELETDSRISLRRSYESFTDRLVELDMPWLSLQETRLAKRFIQRCAEINEKIANKRIDEALRMVWVLYEDRLPDKTLGKATETVLNVARAAYPLYHQEVSNLIHEGAELLFSDYEIDISYLTNWGFKIGDLCLEFGDYHNALCLFKQIWEKLENNLGTDHVAVISALKNIERTLSLMGNHAEAKNVQERIFSMSRQWFGEEHPETLNSLKNLSETLQAQGELEQARTLAEKVLQSSIKLLGEDHPDTLDAMNNLAAMLFALGELEQARTIAEKVLQSRVRILGEDHPATLISMSNLAAMFNALGELEQARTLAEKVLQSRIRMLGEDHPDTLDAMSNLATTFYALGELEQARTLAEKVLQSRVRMLGEDHPKTLSAMSNLATTFYALGELEQARTLAEKVLQSRVRMLGEDHPDTLDAMSNLATTFYDLGELEQARTLAEKVLQSRTRILGEDHPKTLDAINNLAAMLFALGELKQARLLGERMLQIRIQILGEDHPDTLDAMSNLGAIMLNVKGELEQARTLAEKVLQSRTRILGEDHPKTLSAMSNLAFILRRQGDLSGAKILQEKVLEQESLTLGEEHPGNVNSMIDLALTLFRQHDLEGARILQERALDILLRTQGSDHPMARAVMKDLAETLKKMGETERALELFSEVTKSFEDLDSVQHSVFRPSNS
jgi:tetratricopeptide (TPR) repeat protein/cellulose biosynthesis protein BcsQ